MSDRDTPHKNPARVPMTLQAMSEGTAYPEPKHVLGMEVTMPRKQIERTGIYRDKEGNHFFMNAGDYTGRDVEFSHERGSKPSARAKQAAPENKARKPAPETKAKAAPKDKE